MVRCLLMLLCWLALAGPVQGRDENFIILLPIDINAADATTLDRALAGVGPKRAAAIVQDRRLHGPFQTVEDLTRVKGIGEGTIKKNRGRIEVR